MKDYKLGRLLNDYDPDNLRLVAGDGYIIYHMDTDEKLWQWDSEYDGEPYGALETLFNEVGLEVE